MPIAAFTASGDLPLGVHQAELTEVIARFGSGSDQRKLLALRLQRGYRIAAHSGHLLRFVVFGSFVTDKPQPNDVDIFMIMDDAFEFGRTSGETRLLFEHASAQDHFGCSVFWLRQVAAIGGEQQALENWQIKRDGSKRGIVEVVGDGT
jgi:hypothetical protein